MIDIDKLFWVENKLYNIDHGSPSMVFSLPPFSVSLMVCKQVSYLLSPFSSKFETTWKTKQNMLIYFLNEHCYLHTNIIFGRTTKCYHFEQIKFLRVLWLKYGNFHKHHKPS